MNNNRGERNSRKGGFDGTRGNALELAVSRRDQGTLEMVTAAVRHKQTMLAFQPVVATRASGQVAFYEGLIRVLDATGRIIPARDFMPVVEDTELGRDIDCIALEMGLRTLARSPNIRLSINMSARSIGYSRWMRTLERGLKRDPTLAERLILEITESSAMAMPEIVVDFMDNLQVRGIAFALDEFGAGQTVLRYFRDFFFDIVKIDGRFGRGISTDDHNQAIATALITIARQFDMFTVAAGVEKRQDAEMLVDMGVDCLQGYLFGAPTVRPPWLTPQTDAQSA